MKKPDDPLQEVMKNVNWTRWFQVIVPLMQPIVIFGAWLGFAKFDRRADAVSKLIALAEPIPTIDLNVPKPVVLASLYHSTDAALAILNDVITFFKELEIPSAPEIIDEIKEEIKEEVFEGVEEVLPESPAFKTALANCVMNAKKNLPYGSYYLLGPAWIANCMYRKGVSITADQIREKYL